jgi:hypothetical protein
MATGVIYFHRFYMKQSFKTFPRWVRVSTILYFKIILLTAHIKMYNLLEVYKRVELTNLFTS